MLIFLPKVDNKVDNKQRNHKKQCKHKTVYSEDFVQLLDGFFLQRLTNVSICIQCYANAAVSQTFRNCLDVYALFQKPSCVRVTHIVDTEPSVNPSSFEKLFEVMARE